MSATSGTRSYKPKPVDPHFDDLQYILPQSFVPTKEGRVTFRGKNSDGLAPFIAWGAWTWGDNATWNWTDNDMPGLQQAWKLCVQNDLTFIDTAQAYGSGESERIIGALLRDTPRNKVFIQTKWYETPDDMTSRFSPSKAPAKMLRGSLARMDVDYVDCYLVHGPTYASCISQAAEGLAECVDSGMTKTVGVANYSAEDMLEMQAELSKYGVPLATNQCEFSVLRRLPEVSRLLKTCRDNDIILQSYSSLAQGKLTRKYTRENPPPKEYRFSSYPMEESEPTQKVVEMIAKSHNVSMSAVELNYNMSKGILPLAGIRRPQHVERNMQALGWRLTNEEILRIDSVSGKGKATKMW